MWETSGHPSDSGTMVQNPGLLDSVVEVNFTVQHDEIEGWTPTHFQQLKACKLTPGACLALPEKVQRPVAEVFFPTPQTLLHKDLLPATERPQPTRHCSHNIVTNGLQENRRRPLYTMGIFPSAFKEKCLSSSF